LEFFEAKPNLMCVKTIPTETIIIIFNEIIITIPILAILNFNCEIYFLLSSQLTDKWILILIISACGIIISKV